VLFNLSRVHAPKSCFLTRIPESRHHFRKRRKLTRLALHAFLLRGALSMARAELRNVISSGRKSVGLSEQEGKHHHLNLLIWLEEAS
tara:strand:+ start:286 stop:546 length:261 start_codon:yes stop_codon:yes gene_type:complete